MGKFLMAAGLAVMGLAYAGQANAGAVAVRGGPVAVVAGDRYARPAAGPRVGRPLPVAAGRPYYAAHGAPYRGGYYYSGHHHAHWAHRTWDPAFRRYNYYDPYVRGYYFYDPIRTGYYPVTLIVR